MFVDYVEIDVEAGVGGSGAEAWRRETFVPQGGPFGGDGGKGGDVVLEVDPQLTTLLDYRYQRLYKAERGEHGQGKLRTGASAEDLVLRVPPGTVVRDVSTGELLGEMLTPGERLVVARGGRGGRGNAAFVTPTHRAPREWEPGFEGEVRRIALELKLIADVGLVGQPNAGKSTLLSVVTAARPKIADYPFTTLSPNLGVAQLSDSRTFVIADLPGIIEGASEGRGLGHRFLRHIERTRALALLIPCDVEDAQTEYEGLRRELDAYSEELAARPHCVVFTKSDVLEPDEARPKLDAPEAWAIFTISSVSGAGVPDLLEALWKHVQQVADLQRAESATEEEEPWRP